MNFMQKRFASNKAVLKFCYKMAGFNKYGLWRDDLLWEDDDVIEALRRIPEHVVDDRNYRIIRAAHLSLCGDVLPKLKWTLLEDDILYLTPFVKDVIRERRERQEWNNNC